MRGVPLLKLDGGHRNRARLGDSPGLYAGHDGNPVFDRHLVQNRAAGVVVQPALLSTPACGSKSLVKARRKRREETRIVGEGFRHVKVRGGHGRAAPHPP